MIPKFINSEVAKDLLSLAINTSVRALRPVVFAAALDQSNNAVVTQVVVMSAKQAEQCEAILKSNGLVILDVVQRDFE